MRGRLAILDPTDMQRAGIEIHLRPFQIARLGSTQAMPIGD
jgi:hypothetical protein